MHSGNTETRADHNGCVGMDKHPVPGLVDGNGYLTLEEQQKPLEEDEQRYLTPVLKPGASLVGEEAHYSKIQ